MKTRAQTLQLFQECHDGLPSEQRKLLLKDCIQELTAAWKFLAALDSQKTALVFCEALTAIPIALARHFACVDILGPAPNEKAVILELARDKQVNRLRFLVHPEQVRADYGVAILLPGRWQSARKTWQHLLRKLQHTSYDTEIWMIGRQRAKRTLVKKLIASQTKGGSTQACRFYFRTGYLRSERGSPAFVKPSAGAARESFSLYPNRSTPAYVGAMPTIKNSAIFGKLAHGKQSVVHVLKCYGGTAGQSLLERLLPKLERATGRVWRIGASYRILEGGKVMIDMHAADDTAPQRAFLKLPLISQADTRLRENAYALLRFAQLESLAAETQRLFPKLLAEGERERQPFYLESCISGLSIDRAGLEHETILGLSREVFALWFEVQQAFTRRMRVTELVFQSVFGNLLQRYEGWLGLSGELQGRLQRVLDYWHQRFDGREIGIGLVHGDFSIKNLMVDPHSGRLTGIIDWDLSNFFSIPLLDLLHFFVRLDSRSFREPPPVIALRLVREPTSEFRRLTDSALIRFGYTWEDLEGIVMLYWLFRQRGYIGSLKHLDSKFLRRHFVDVLTVFEHHLL